ncbi:hypothetical protein ACJMK2_004153 [Sinanodonta woodiana]|uniref:Uncharacterized protein n=1 Tax=Sinanodonta woodiana TaxID=1069815 RepID=A0ABD3Y1Y0_SINWO
MEPWTDPLQSTMGRIHYNRPWTDPLQWTRGKDPLQSTMGQIHYNRLWDGSTTIDHGTDPLQSTMGRIHYNRPWDGSTTIEHGRIHYNSLVIHNNLQKKIISEHTPFHFNLLSILYTSVIFGGIKTNLVR